MTRKNGWTAERRKRQATMIHQWHPWTSSTGPRTAAGKAKAARNAFQKDPIRRELLDIAAELRRVRRSG